jgi:biotin operon repressor
MTKQQLRTQLENKGYKVSTLMQGGYIAKKGQQTYKAATITELARIIFK